MRCALRLALAIPLVSALPYACGHGHDDPDPPSGYEDVIYEGEVTDEALLALASSLDQSPPVEGGPEAPTLAEPTATELTAAVIPTFRWATATPEAGARPADLLRPGATPAATAWIGPLRELLGPERAAHAHGTPYTGYATFLVFSAAGNDKLVRTFTSWTTFTPTRKAWDALAAAGAPITLDLIGAEFAENRIATAGGPFKGPSFTFTITP